MAKPPALEPGKRYECKACGNLTRFDVVKTTRTSSMYHFSIGGLYEEEEVTVLSVEIEQLMCRWCGPNGNIEMIDAHEVPPGD